MNPGCEYCGPYSTLLNVIEDSLDQWRDLKNLCISTKNLDSIVRGAAF